MSTTRNYLATIFSSVFQKYTNVRSVAKTAAKEQNTDIGGRAQASSPFKKMSKRVLYVGLPTNHHAHVQHRGICRHREHWVAEKVIPDIIWIWGHLRAWSTYVVNYFVEGFSVSQPSYTSFSKSTLDLIYELIRCPDYCWPGNREVSTSLDASTAPSTSCQNLAYLQPVPLHCLYRRQLLKFSNLKRKYVG